MLVGWREALVYETKWKWVRFCVSLDQLASPYLPVGINLRGTRRVPSQNFALNGRFVASCAILGNAKSAGSDLHAYTVIQRQRRVVFGTDNGTAWAPRCRMYKLNKTEKQLTKLKQTTLNDQGLLERFDLETWIAGSPGVLGENLLVLATEYILPSNLRIDILALDKSANIVVVELKRDQSGGDIEWQAIKYASYCSSLTADEIYEILAARKTIDTDAARDQIEQFIDEELDQLNHDQRIILVARDYHPDVASAVLWLREYDVDVRCVRIASFVDTDGTLFLNPEVIIPLPEAETYTTRREKKQQKQRDPARSPFSLEKGNFTHAELEQQLLSTLNRDTDLTPRLAAFLDILMSADRTFDREELKKALVERGIGGELGQAGHFLSNLSQFLTKKSNPHLRQLIAFEGGSRAGQLKDQFRLVTDYRLLVEKVLNSWREAGHAKEANA